LLACSRRTQNRILAQPIREVGLTKRGNQWHFGLKAYVGADSRTKLILAVVATLADRRVLPDLLAWPRGPGWGDQTYRCRRAVIRQHAPQARTSPAAAIFAKAWSTGRAQKEPDQVKDEGSDRAFDRGSQTSVRLC
jgi:hypothetical protein